MADALNTETHSIDATAERKPSVATRIAWKLIALTQIIGGAYGLVRCFEGFATTNDVFTAVGIGLFAFAILAGGALWLGTVFGRQASFLTQAAQTFMFACPLFAYTFMTGPFLRPVVMVETNGELSIGCYCSIGAGYMITVLRPSPMWTTFAVPLDTAVYIGFNVVAFAFAIFLLTSLPIYGTLRARWRKRRAGSDIQRS